jgi:hypothetical protein
VFKSTHLVHFTAQAGREARDAVEATLRGIEGCRLVQPTLPGVYNGGHLMAHFQFEDEAHWRARQTQLEAVLGSPDVGHVDSAAYEGGVGGVREPGLEGGVYRALFFCVNRPVDTRTLEQFEAEMRRMPHYIPAICNWQLSRVAHASGARGWTHVWEQEFANIGGLAGEYMLHPYHWARIDRWFDPECTQWMIDTTLCHSFCALERSILSPAKGRHSPT